MQGFGFTADQVLARARQLVDALKQPSAPARERADETVEPAVRATPGTVPAG